MIVHIAEDGTPTLEGAGVFTAFAVRAAAGVDAGAALAAAGIGGSIADSDEVLVSIDWVKREVAAAGVENGESQLEGMLGYAASKGWVDNTTDSIRSHVE